MAPAPLPDLLPARLLPSPWWQTFNTLVTNAETRLFLMAPYIGRKPLEQVHKLLQAKSVAPAVQIATCFSADSLSGGSLDIGALQEFMQQHPATLLHHVPKLHAKVYFNEGEAVITSANLTTNGLLQNREYGVHTSGPEVVRQLWQDLSGYLAIGTRILPQTLLNIELVVRAHQKTIGNQEAPGVLHWQHLLPAQQAAVTTELLDAHSHGESTQRILKRTIRYVLAKYGPLPTAALHEHIQQLQPELCDDATDRVINGVHYGKKWKHHVRSAQSHLKSAREIALTAGKWHLAEKQS